MKKRLVLIDGNSLLHRAYHAYPGLRTSTGELVNAVYGFTSILLNNLFYLKPSHVIVTWDVREKTFRHKEYPEYKAGRPPMDQELVDQIGLTKEMVKRMNIPQFEKAGYEADDLIGTLSKQAIEKGEQKTEVIIVTGDRDALQLIEGDRVKVCMPSRGRNNNGGQEVFDEKSVELKYGMKPEQMIDLKGLMGDASDNIKGVRGVGQVTATKLIQAKGTIDKVYEELDDLPVSERIKTLLREGEEDARKSRMLVTIDRKVPIELKWKECRLSDYDKKEVMELLEKLEFKSLVAKLPNDDWEREVEEVFL